MSALSRRNTVLASLAAAAALFFGLNVLSGVALKAVHLDLTENRLYTLSEGSRGVLRELRQPIQLRFFFSESLAGNFPQIKLYGHRVRELLERYADLAPGRITLQVIDPEPFSDAEDQALQNGIQAVPVDAAGRALYLGLVGSNSVDDVQVIPFFPIEKEQFLEYDLTRLVYNLNLPRKTSVGVISGLPLEFGPGGVMAAMRGESRPYAIMNELRQAFQVKVLDAADLTAVDPGIDVVLVAHPRRLAPAAQYAIDQFVLRGGRAMVLVDPHAESAAAAPDTAGGPDLSGGVQGSSIPRLFAAWGVDLKSDQFVADLGLAQRVQTGQAGPRNVADYVVWLNVGPNNMNKDDVVTGELATLNLASAGSLRPVEGAGTKFTPLIWSSDNAMLAPVEKLRGRPNPEALIAEHKPTGERYALAARVSGPVKTAFPDGPPKEAKDSKRKPADPAQHLKESAAPVNLIIVADADLLDDRFWLRTQELLGQRVAYPIANNGDFILNGLDNLAGSDNLISLRSRGHSQRPFEVVDAMRRAAEQKYLAQEQALQKKLDETQARIVELQGKREGAGGAILSAEERAALEGFRTDLVATRKELRNVKRDLSQDIERLDATIKFINIGLAPVTVGLLAGGIALVRRRRRLAA
jgi:ABC-type uncharacterized transport system involved in gliding motility auxiliary subunit